MDTHTLEGALTALEERGHRFERSSVRGLRLAHPMHLDSHLIGRDLGTHRVGRSVVCFDEVGSTNDVGLEAASGKKADGLVVLSEFQRNGRGRTGRKWISPAGQNILLSVLLVEGKGAGIPHRGLTIAGGVAVAEAVEEVCSLRCGLKFPNDVLVGSAKLAGILIELRRVGTRHCAVIGIGVNVNACPPPEQVDFPATSLSEHLGHPVERTELVRAILRRLDGWVMEISKGHTDALHESWISRCGMINQRVVVLCDGTRFEGRVLDVSPREGLVLCRDDGSRVHLPPETSTIVPPSTNRGSDR